MATNAETVAAEPRPAALGEEGFVPQPHVEDAELAALEAEAAKAPAEGAPAEQPEQPVGETAAPAAAAPAAAAEAEEGEQPRGEDGRWIPKARFDEAVGKERQRSEQAIAAAAYYKGQLDAKAGTTAAQPTPEQEMQQLEAAVEQKAQDFDEGKIGLAEYKRFENLVNRRVADLRQPAAPQRASDDMRLDELTTALPERFPILNSLERSHIDRLLPIAKAELAFEGIDVHAGPRSDYLLRERVAQLAQDRFGEADPATPQPPAQPNGRQADPTKAARDKLALARTMPPTLNKFGTAQVPQDAYSPDRIESMDLDELATAVPDSVLRRLTGQ